jgi:hypothetical protein
MITTAQFSKDAQEFVKRIPQKIVLIGGKQLAELMIDHNVGVAPIPRKSYSLSGWMRITSKVSTFRAGPTPLRYRIPQLIQPLPVMVEISKNANPRPAAIRRSDSTRPGSCAASILVATTIMGLAARSPLGLANSPMTVSKSRARSRSRAPLGGGDRGGYAAVSARIL